MTKNTPPGSDKDTDQRPGRDALDRPLVKRFYEEVSAAEIDGKFHIHLDGKPVRTPAREKLSLPTARLADKICEEWRAQGEYIEPQSMPLTQLANTAIDGVSFHLDEVREATLAFAGSDLLCYRAERPQDLVKIQGEKWDPVLNWIKTRFDAHFEIGAGIMHVAQPKDDIAKIDAHLKTYDPLILCPLQVMTTLTGSVFLALAVAEQHLSEDEAWHAAHVDEDWQFEHWGGDVEAERRREKRHKEMKSAAEFLRLVREI